MIETNDLEMLLYKNKDEKKKKKKEKEKNKLKRNYHVHYTTKNASFIKMYRILKDLKVKNNKFFLAIYDKSLIDVDPYDEDLTQEQKTRIMIECKNNLWYFLREICRVVVPGKPIAPGGGIPYSIHRGNLALTYCCSLNLNTYTELPRQNFKSVSVDAIFLWLLNFGTTTSKMLMLNKDGPNAKENIQRVKDMRDCLPLFLQSKVRYNEEQKALKPQDNKEYIENEVTNNRIDMKNSPTSEAAADNCGRGCTQPFQWFDEFALLYSAI